MNKQILLVTITNGEARVQDVTAEWQDRSALVDQIREAQRQRDEAEATSLDSLAALGAAETDAAVWKRRAERAEAAIADTVRDLRAAVAEASHTHSTPAGNETQTGGRSEG